MYSFKDRLIDWANQKGAWTRILVAVGITLLITAIILAAAMPSKGVVNANAAQIGELQGNIVTIADALGTKASQTELDNWGQNVTDVLGSQASTIRGLGTRMGNAETRINEAGADIATIQGRLTEFNSPPEAYLTGTFGNYTLHTKSGEAGNFTANVHLVYSTPIYVGNTTTHDETLIAFYSGINFTEATSTYVPIATFNGTAWRISEVWFNIGTFKLAANNVTAIGITCAGLNSMWEPEWVYVEVSPVLMAKDG